MFTNDERSKIFDKFTIIIPDEKILPIATKVVKTAADIGNDDGYFDTLIASTALYHQASIISTDSFYSDQGITTEW